MLEIISIEIRFKSSTVYEIWDKLKTDVSLNKLLFLQGNEDKDNKSYDFHLLWRKSVKFWKSNSLKKEDYELLIETGDSLGTSDTEGQLAEILLLKEKLALLNNDALKERDKKSKLYKTLGFLIGVFIAVMII